MLQFDLQFYEELLGSELSNLSAERFFGRQVSLYRFCDVMGQWVRCGEIMRSFYYGLRNYLHETVHVILLAVLMTIKCNAQLGSQYSHLLYCNYHKEEHLCYYDQKECTLQ